MPSAPSGALDTRVSLSAFHHVREHKLPHRMRTAVLRSVEQETTIRALDAERTLKRLHAIEDGHRKDDWANVMSEVRRVTMAFVLISLAFSVVVGRVVVGRVLRRQVELAWVLRSRGVSLPLWPVRAWRAALRNAGRRWPAIVAVAGTLCLAPWVAVHPVNAWAQTKPAKPASAASFEAASPPAKAPAAAPAKAAAPSQGAPAPAAGAGKANSASAAAPAAKAPATAAGAKPVAAPATSKPAPAPPSAGVPPSAGTAAAGAPAAGPGGVDAATYVVRLRDLESRVEELKEQVRRSHTRLSLLSESVLAAGVGGARAEIVFRNSMSNAFRVTGVLVVLDGAVQYNEKGEDAAHLQQKVTPIFDGAVPPGDHTLQIVVSLQGHGYGVFSYLRGYKFEARSTHSFTVRQGKALRVEAIAWEKGTATTPLHQKPAVRFVETGLSRGDGTDGTEEPTDGAEPSAQ